MDEDFACGYVRAEVPAREINNISECGVRIDCKLRMYISDFFNTDIMVFQRRYDLATLQNLINAKQHGIKIIYEVDDDLFNVPSTSKKAHKFYSAKDVMQNMQAFLNNADAITVSTQALANAIRKRISTTPIFIVENYLDVDSWVKAYAEKQTIAKKCVTIGWMASSTHKADAPLVTPALLKIMKKHKNVRLNLIGWVGWKEIGKEFEPFKDRITTSDWVNISALPEKMMDFDIGIAPLVDNEFNKCKSAIKIFQYWALGIPAVVSDLPEYASKIDNNVDGFLVKSSEQWYDHLEKLVSDDNARKLMGAYGRKKLLEKYNIKNNVSRWINTFLKVKTL